MRRWAIRPPRRACGWRPIRRWPRRRRPTTGICRRASEAAAARQDGNASFAAAGRFAKDQITPRSPPMSEDQASSYAPGSDASGDSAVVRPAELAAYLAARMCHDFISPASAIVSGLDLLDDPSAQDMREEAMGLIATSARKLTDLLSFARVAFGASASAETFDARELERLAQG